MEIYNKKEFVKAGLTMEFIQDNESKSTKGVLRGFHFQTKHIQGKFVIASVGSAFDVAINLRKGSPTFRKWDGLILTAEKKK